MTRDGATVLQGSSQLCMAAKGVQARATLVGRHQCRRDYCISDATEAHKDSWQYSNVIEEYDHEPERQRFGGCCWEADCWDTECNRDVYVVTPFTEFKLDCFLLYLQKTFYMIEYCIAGKFSRGFNLVIWWSMENRQIPPILNPAIQAGWPAT